MRKIGFTLLELIIVIVIIGVLSTLGLTHYASIREKALDKEAISNLKLIKAAARVYRMETGSYPVLLSPQDINSNLTLALPTVDSGGKWYYTTNNGCSAARRYITGSFYRIWMINSTLDEPVSVASNPCS